MTEEQKMATSYGEIKDKVFDLILCRLLAKDAVTYEELCDLGEGGLCLGCDICTYPNCGFGK